MTTAAGERSEGWGPHSPELQQFLLYLGSGLTAAGEAVNEIQDHLEVVAGAYGAPEARIVVLPTFVVVSLEPSRPVTLEPTAQLRGVLRLDQTTAVFDVLKLARVGGIDPAEGSRRVLESIAMRPRFGALIRLLGHMVLTVGLCLVLQPTGADLILAAFFGLLVGLLTVGDYSAPYSAVFATAVTVALLCVESAGRISLATWMRAAPKCM